MKAVFCLIACAVVAAHAQAPVRDASTTLVPTGAGGISGIIRDEANRPLRRASVSINGDMRLNLTTITDDEGRFAFSDLPAGRFTITAKKAGYPSTSYRAKRPNRPGAGVLLAAGQQITGIGITLARGGVLTGTVFDDHGQPMPGVPVMAWEVRTSLGGERTLDFPITGGESVTSDDRGIYRVYGLPPGEYTVDTAWFYSGSAMDTRVPTDAEIRAAFLAVTQPESAQREVTTAARPPEANYNYTRVFMPDSIDPMTAVTVQLGAAEERDALDVHMQFRAVSKIEGTVVGPDGPANRARMEAWTRGRVEALNTGTVWSSGEDGRFTSRSLGPGEYTLRAEVPARGGKPAMFASTDITITTGDPVSVTLRLEPAMTLTGRILLEATTATPPADLSRARVGLFPTANGGAANSGTSVVDPSGAFTITGITPGRFRVTATLPNTAASGPPAWTLRSVTSGGRDLTDLPIDIAPGDAPSLTVTFTDQLAELSGTLTDAGGQPAADYFVIALPADRRYWLLQSRRIVSARPDVRGHFMFRALPPGDYLIAATTDLVQRDLSDPTALSELAAQSTAVRIAAGEQKVFDLKIGK